EVEIVWGTDSQQLDNRAIVDSGSFGTFSLTELKPDTRYFFKIATLRDSGLVISQHGAYPLAKSLTAILDDEPLTFTTAASDRDPVTWHVSPTGDNQNDGDTLTNPLATIQ